MHPCRLSRSRAIPPLVLAASQATSWHEVLSIYTRCQRLLCGIYQPSTAELVSGLNRMTSTWSISLFYHHFIKEKCGQRQPNHAIVMATLLLYKRHGSIPGMQRLLQEDLHASNVQELKAMLVMSTYAGMWQRSLQILRCHPRLVSKPCDRRMIARALAMHGMWVYALRILTQPPQLELTSHVLRPVIRQLSFVGEHDRALYWAARVLAAGHSFDLALLSACGRTLRVCGHAAEALALAQRLRLFALSRNDAQRVASVYADLVHCLYEYDPYRSFTLARVLEDIVFRTRPRELTLRGGAAARRSQFRLCTEAELFLRFRGVLQSLSAVYSRLVAVPRWYSKALVDIVTNARANAEVVIVLDTNFLLQCAARNHTVEHFYASMQSQFPILRGTYRFATVVVPFTVIQEAHRLVWDRQTRVQHAMRLLLWSRIQGILKMPSVYTLSLGAEYPTLAFCIIAKMAYSKMSATVAGDYARDPDLRVLNVCLSLQHTLRTQELARMQGCTPPDGTMLFAFMKYHVRRYNNTVKGSATNQLLLCTMDKKLASAAGQLGINVFPRLQSPS